MQHHRFNLIRAAFIVFFAGLGSSAAQESTTIGGYGELHYNDADGSSAGRLDFHRFVIFLGHSFNDRLSFKSEMEIEHTKIEATEMGGAEGGEVAVEQAYLDWRFTTLLGLKAGILLPPIGIINHVHEPPTFNGVERPNIDYYIIPTTWRESGIGVYGSVAEGLNYQLYLVAGLNAEGFSGRNGIRKGRQEALESSFTNPSLTGKVDYHITTDLALGASFFAGSTTGGVDSLGSGTLALLSYDVEYLVNRFAFRSVGAFESIGDADKINHAFGLDVADQIFGISLEAAYDILPLIDPAPENSLSLFTRYENYNTQASVTNIAADPLNSRNDITVGATYNPTYNTVFKIDYQFLNNKAGANTRQLNLGVGYHF